MKGSGVLDSGKTGEGLRPLWTTGRSDAGRTRGGGRGFLTRCERSEGGSGVVVVRIFFFSRRGRAAGVSAALAPGLFAAASAVEVPLRTGTPYFSSLSSIVICKRLALLVARRRVFALAAIAP
jgi:hypothetical protein